MNGEDTSSFSSEEEKEGDAAPAVNGLSLKPSWSSVPHSKAPPSVDKKEEEDDEEEGGSCLPTIFFSHTVEPKKVRLRNNIVYRFVAVTYCVFSPFLLILAVYFSFFLVPSPLSFASGEDKHRKKHHIEVQRKERTEGALEEEKEKRPQ